jgi:hypothetical protein
VIDSTCVKGQRAAGGARIKRSDARAAAGRTKVDAPTDVIGRSYALMLTAGNVSDVKAAHALLERAGPMRYLFADIRATLQPAANAPSPEIWPASAAFAPDGPVCPVFFREPVFLRWAVRCAQAKMRRFAERTCLRFGAMARP